MFRRNVTIEAARAVRSALESTGFRFAVDSAGRLLAQHVLRPGRRLQETDIAVVRRHKAEILAAFGV